MASLNDIIRNINHTDDNTKKGSMFEKLCLYFLTHDKIFAPKFSGIWLWSQWPGNNGMPDTGIDIVAKFTEGESYCAVQCKFRQNDSAIPKAEIDSFMSLSSKSIYSQRILFALTDDFNDKAKDTLTDQNPPVKVLTLQDLANSSINWEEFSFENPNHVKYKVKALLPHQVTAVNDVLNGLAHHDRGKLIMACGTGKTFTSLKIAEKYAGRGGNILVLVPSISLLNQSITSWNYDHDENLPLISLPVCSDSTAGYDEEDLKPQDLTMTPTTNADSLIDQWQNAQGKNYSMCVIFSTYQSLNVIHDAQAKGFPMFDLVICDEAHRTSGLIHEGKRDSYFRLVHDDKYIHSRKRIYMTATPKIFTENAKAKAKDENILLCSMDDEKVYGPEFHRLSFSKSVHDELLTDYKVMIFMIEKEDKEDKEETDLPAMIQGIKKALAKDISPNDYDFIADDKDSMRRAVAFSNTIAGSKKFMNIFTNQANQITDDSMLTFRVHHVDGTTPASERSSRLRWLASSSHEDSECRILTNARCLCEGVDVPALDAVIFLNPRSSEIDIVQSVGRVMRKSKGKKFGYVILPVIVHPDESPEDALDNNESYQTVWKVLQALRAHDDHFNAEINSIDFGKSSSRVRVTGRHDKNNDSWFTDELAEKYTHEIYIRMVRKCGDREYWSSWVQDLVSAFQEITLKIKSAISQPGNKSQFDSFTEELKAAINPSITPEQAIEMLAQHITSKEVFDAIFEGFSAYNPVSQTMQKIRTILENSGNDLNPHKLSNFNERVRNAAEAAKTGEAKQKLLREIYENFFKQAFPETAEKLGIVYTPEPIVDFIIKSADWAVRNELGISEGLSADDVHILDPFSGTGTFTARLIHSGLIPHGRMNYKYQNEIHANEMLLLAYYISAINIEAAYNQSEGGVYTEFQGMVLADTFMLNDSNDRTPYLHRMFYLNGKRAAEQEDTRINVIIGNPPYNVGGKTSYYHRKIKGRDKAEGIDGKIADSYARYSDATNKSSLYDSYIRAIKWASERVNDTGGIVCYVTNASFIDGSAMDGMRKELAEKFTSIYIFNLRGNQRGDWRKEGEKVFGEGSQCPIAITLFVRDIRRLNQPSEIWYYECADGMRQAAKLKELEERVSFGEMMSAGIMTRIRPDKYNDWINQTSNDYEECFSLGSKKNGRQAIFGERYSRGIESGCDALHSNFSREELCRNIKTRYPDAVIDDDTVRDVLYSPYVREYMYFSSDITYRSYQMFQIFPKSDSENLLICISGVGSKYFSVLMINRLPALTIMEKGQCFPLYWYEEVGSVFIGKNVHTGPNVHIGKPRYERRDGISDQALSIYRERYHDGTITKRDIFFYIYGVLSSREYAERFGNDTKKALARVPFVRDIKTFREFANAGYELAMLHVNYESVDEWPVVYEGDKSCVRIQKMRIAERNDERVIRVNDSLVISGIPSEAWRYVVNGRSALEWIVERYCDSTDKASGIRNDCNMWGIEHGNESYVLSLIARVVRVSVESVRIIEGMPEFGL